MTSLNRTCAFIAIFGSCICVCAQSINGAYKRDDGTTLIISPASNGKGLIMIEYETGMRLALSRVEELKYNAVKEGRNISFNFHLIEPQLVEISIMDRGKETTSRKIQLREKYMNFYSNNIKLYGKLVLPAKSGKYSAVVIAHGSDNYSAVDVYKEPYIFASQGIACFVYDKRGTGKSEGKSELSFAALSQDLVAAVESIVDEPEIDLIGLSGYSQGGWIVPLAAIKTSLVKFAVINYGLTMSIAEEDRYETPLKLKEMGINDSLSIQELKDLNSVLHYEVKTDFNIGWYDHIESKLEEYRGRPWLDTLRKIPTTWLGSMLNMDKATILKIAPPMMRTIQPFYDPVETLEKVTIPMLWVVAGEDIEAPPEQTITTIKKMKASGKPFELKIYPNTDHGILKYKKIGPRRVHTDYADSYFKDIVKWINSRAKIITPR